MKIDKTTTNDNMEPIRITDERAYTTHEMAKIGMAFQQTDCDPETQWQLHL